MMADRWGDSRRDREALDRWLTTEPEAVYYPDDYEAPEEIPCGHCQDDWSLENGGSGFFIVCVCGASRPVRLEPIGEWSQ